MDNTCWDVAVSRMEKSGELVPKYDTRVALILAYDPQGISVILKQGNMISSKLRLKPILSSR